MPIFFRKHEIMNWKYKAIIMNLCSCLPWKGIYPIIQKTMGRLQSNPMSRLPSHAKMCKWILSSGNKIQGKNFFEVGTGHIPIAPIGFFLCGANSIITVDLNRRIDWKLTSQSIHWIIDNKDHVRSIYNNTVDENVFNERFSILIKYNDEPKTFFNNANIKYLAPMDAANTCLTDGSIDYHFSITVLEHIPMNTIKNILTEAKRILNPQGLAFHFIDLSDHFQHTDNSIIPINFLRYSESQWQRIAGNEFAYCNRLRKSDYINIFRELGFTVDRQERYRDQSSIKAVQSGRFCVNTDFADYDLQDLCTTTLRVALGISKNF